jgi:hypothetical protein
MDSLANQWSIECQGEMIPSRTVPPPSTVDSLSELALFYQRMVYKDSRCLLPSVPECKVNIIKVIRSILRENVRRNMRPAERGCKERLRPLRSTLPSSARIGESHPYPVPKKITALISI